jgi:hypothetical protein
MGVNPHVKVAGYLWSQYESKFFPAYMKSGGNLWLNLMS